MTTTSTLQLTIIADTKGLDEAERKIKQLQQTIRDLGHTVEESLKLDIEQFRKEIEAHEKTIRVLKEQQRKDLIETMTELLLTRRSSIPAGTLAKELDRIVRNMLQSEEMAELGKLGFNIIKGFKERRLEAHEKGIQILTPEQKQTLLDDIKLIEESIEFLDKAKEGFIQDERLLRNDPFQVEIDNIRKLIEETKKTLKGKEELLNNLKNGGGKINEENINNLDIENELLKDNKQKSSDAIESNKQFIDALSKRSEEMQRGNGILELTKEQLLELPGKLALVDGAFIDATANQGEFAESFENIIKNAGEGAVILGFTKEELLGLRDATDEATKSTENLGENGFTAVKENVEQAGNKLGTLDTNLMNVADRNKDVANSQDQVNQAVGESGVVYDGASKSAERYGDTIEQVQNKGGFFEGIKQGFIDFVENVQSNSELMADFFADTLSQMSQSFSDLFFNVITGRFDNLKDLAKQAFEAILRAFLDLVSAIATRQIIVSIAGVFGLGAKGAGAEDVIEAGKSAVDFIGNQFPATPGGEFAPTELDPDTLLPVEDSGIGAGLLGISIGSALGSIINSDLTGLQQGISFGLGAAGAVTGFLIGGPVGAAIGGFIGSLVVPIITALFKKTPRLDIDFDSVKTEVGRRAAEVAEFLDPEFFKNEIAQISVKRGGVGLGQGGDEGIKDIIQEKIEETIDAVQAIINKLPSDLAAQLNEALLNTPIDIETVVAGERLLEFDAKGKEIAAKFKAFIEGELSAKFLFAIRDFFQVAFESLGVLPGKAGEFLEGEFEKFKNAGSREERAQIGQEFLASFNAFVDAFNIVSGNVNDAIGQTIQSVRSLSQELGFDAVPSIGELTDKLGELLENAELDAETVQMYADLRNAIVQGISDIINSITGLIGKISQLNSTIVGLGGAAVNIIPFLDEAQAKLVDFYTTNIGNLSLGEQETFLDEILGIANAKLAEEQAAFQRAQAARQKAEEAQRARIEKRIDNLNKEKDKINEVFQKRIEALNEELQIAESFAQLTESIRQTLDSILFSPESVLTGVEQVNALQSNITNLQAQLASAVDPEKQLEIAGRLEEAFKTLFDTAGDAFGVNSPEFVAIFDQVTGGLENLADFTGERGRSVEEISAEIERLTAVNEATLKSIDAKIEAAQERLASIGQSTADNTFRASQELTELFEFIRNEYMRILEERFAQLEEVSEFGFQSEVEGLGVIAGFTEENLTVLKGVGEEAAKHTGLLTEIAGKLGAVAGFQHGSEGFKNFGRGTLAVLHGLEAVVTKKDIAGIQESLLSQIAGGGISGLADRLAGERDGRDGLSRGGFIAGMRPGGGFIPEFPLSGTRPSPDEPVNHVTEMSVDINVNVNGGSQASIASLAGEIENMMVRSIRQGRVRKELQEAAVRRVG